MVNFFLLFLSPDPDADEGDGVEFEVDVLATEGALLARGEDEAEPVPMPAEEIMLDAEAPPRLLRVLFTGLTSVLLAATAEAGAKGRENWMD